MAVGGSMAAWVFAAGVLRRPPAVRSEVAASGLVVVWGMGLVVVVGVLLVVMACVAVVVAVGRIVDGFWKGLWAVVEAVWVGGFWVGTGVVVGRTVVAEAGPEAARM